MLRWPVCGWRTRSWWSKPWRSSWDPDWSGWRCRPGYCSDVGSLFDHWLPFEAGQISFWCMVVPLPFCPCLCVTNIPVQVVRFVAVAMLQCCPCPRVEFHFINHICKFFRNKWVQNPLKAIRATKWDSPQDLKTSFVWCTAWSLDAFLDLQCSTASWLSLHQYLAYVTDMGFSSWRDHCQTNQKHFAAAQKRQSDKSCFQKTQNIDSCSLTETTVHNPLRWIRAELLASKWSDGLWAIHYGVIAPSNKFILQLSKLPALKKFWLFGVLHQYYHTKKKKKRFACEVSFSQKVVSPTQKFCIWIPFRGLFCFVCHKKSITCVSLHSFTRQHTRGQWSHPHRIGSAP